MIQPQSDSQSPFILLLLVPLWSIVCSGCGQDTVRAAKGEDAFEPQAAVSIIARAGEVSGGQSTAQPTEPEITQVALEAERELTPREHKIQDARNANATAARIQVVMAEVATSEPSEAEKPLISELKEQHGVYRLLQKDIADEQDNPEQLGLRMPWESRGIKDISSAAASLAGQRSRPTYNLNLSAQIGGEQLASIRRAICESQAQLTNLRSRRAWDKLTETEKAACRKHQREFADEASGENERKLDGLNEQLKGLKVEPKTLVARANLHWQRGNLNAALADYSRCLKLDAENHEARIKYAELCELQGQAFSAKEEYRKVAHSNSPLSAEAYVRWGNLLLSERRIDPAMQAAKLAVKANPKLASAHVLMAELYQRAGIRGQVIDSLVAATEAAPDAPSNHYRLANVYSQLRQPENALKHYSQAIELDPTWWRPLAGRALLLLQKGEKQAAVDDLTTAIEWAPQERQLREDRAFILQQLGRHDEAQKDLDAARKLK